VFEVLHAIPANAVKLLIGFSAVTARFQNHRLEQRIGVDSRGMQSGSRFGVDHSVDSVLDLGDPDGSLHDIRAGAGKHEHEIIDPSRGWFELIAIDSIIFVVHKRTARFGEALAERSETGQYFRAV
jgi:hypothetical protein